MAETSATNRCTTPCSFRNYCDALAGICVKKQNRGGTFQVPHELLCERKMRPPRVAAPSRCRTNYYANARCVRYAWRHLPGAARTTMRTQDASAMRGGIILMPHELLCERKMRPPRVAAPSRCRTNYYANARCVRYGLRRLEAAATLCGAGATRSQGTATSKTPLLFKEGCPVRGGVVIKDLTQDPLPACGGTPPWQGESFGRAVAASS